MTNKKHLIITILIFAILFTLDQVTKYLLTNVNQILIPNFLSIHYTQNTGAAWSLFSGKVEILSVISIIFLIVLIVFSHKFKEKTLLYSISYGLILTGALGNLYDRIFFGYVRDFISADFITFTSFPIFNIADSCLVVGVILFAIFVLIIYPRKQRKQKR